jgi:hypothetical protein
MKQANVFFTYTLKGKEYKDTKYFSYSGNKEELESIIYNHLNTLYPNLVSHVSVTSIQHV